MSKPKPPWPPNDADVIDALEKAGFPLELRIFRAFEQEGFDPVMPFRSRIDSERRTKEIDVLGALNHPGSFVEAGEVLASRIALKVFVQAKRLHDQVVVGLRGPVRDDYGLRVARSHVAGLPSWGTGVGRDLAQNLVIGQGGFVEAFAPLTEAPQCVHWSTVRLLNKDGWHYRAEHEAGFAEDLQTLIGAMIWQEREWSTYLLDNVATGNIKLTINCMFLQPLMVVDAPICVFDSVAGGNRLVPVDWLTVHVGDDIDGEVVHRSVDVVSEAGLGAMIQRYRSVFEHLKVTAETNKHAWIMAAVGEVKIRQRNRP